MTYKEKKLKYIRKTKKRKYGNTRREYDGFWYDSILEANVAQELDWRIKAGELTKVERQVKLDLLVDGKRVATYRIDFIAHRKDGSREFIEVKGFETGLWRLKWKILESIFEDQFKKHPDDEMIVIRK